MAALGRYAPGRPRPIKKVQDRFGYCPVCGGGTTKSKVFEERFTPLNKNPDGSVRSVAQIQATLDLVAAAWRPDFTHEKCKET